MYKRNIGFVVISIVLVGLISIFMLADGARAESEYFSEDVTAEMSENWEMIEVAPGFTLINNMWATEGEGTEQTIYHFDDGTYGWEWEREATGIENPNFPEILFGVKPWGDEEFTLDALPLRIGEIDSLEMELDVIYDIFEDAEGEGNWNLAFELWLTKDKPAPGEDVADTITDEVMIWFDWQDGLWDWVDPVETEAVADDDYVYEYNVSDGQWGDEGYFDGHWHYSQFRISRPGTIPETVDLTLFLDYIQDELDRSEDVWLGALELGMEYEDETAGMTRIRELTYEINGEYFESVE